MGMLKDSIALGITEGLQEGSSIPEVITEFTAGFVSTISPDKAACRAAGAKCAMTALSTLDLLLQFAMLKLKARMGISAPAVRASSPPTPDTPTAQPEAG